MAGALQRSFRTYTAQRLIAGTAYGASNTSYDDLLWWALAYIAWYQLSSANGAPDTEALDTAASVLDEVWLVRTKLGVLECADIGLPEPYCAVLPEEEQPAELSRKTAGGVRWYDTHQSRRVCWYD